MTRVNQLYDSAVTRYADWDLARSTSKRLRMVINLIAMEEHLKELGAGALPPGVMLTLRLLSDYKESGRRRYYKTAIEPRDMDSVIPFEELVGACGHLNPLDPVLARLTSEEADRIGCTEAVFCTPCAAGQKRRIVKRLVRLARVDAGNKEEATDGDVQPVPL